MWKEWNPNPTGRKNAGDCSVRAVAKALDVDWETAYAKIALNGFLMGDVISSDSVWGSVLRQTVSAGKSYRIPARIAIRQKISPMSIP